MSSNDVIRLDIACPKCGSYTYEFKYKKPHVGLYCKCCLAWIKWLSKKEKQEYDIVIQEDETVCEQNTTAAFLDDEATKNILASVDDDEVPWL